MPRNLVDLKLVIFISGNKFTKQFVCFSLENRSTLNSERTCFTNDEEFSKQ